MNRYHFSTSENILIEFDLDLILLITFNIFKMIYLDLPLFILHNFIPTISRSHFHNTKTHLNDQKTKHTSIFKAGHDIEGLESLQLATPSSSASKHRIRGSPNLLTMRLRPQPRRHGPQYVCQSHLESLQNCASYILD